MQVYLMMFTVMMLAACTPEPVTIAPQLFLPDFATSKVVPLQRHVVLSRKQIDDIKHVVSIEQSKFFNDLVYNYIHNFYGLEICNTKLDALHNYLNLYEENTLDL